MGVDTIVRLPAGVKIRDVADVIGILLGKPHTWTDCADANHCVHGLTEPTKSGWTHVEGITYETSNNQPECCTIKIPDIGNQWWFFYHFEGEHGGPLMMGRSRSERIALHVALAKFFGGTVDFSDCDSKSVDYRRKPPAWLLRTHENKYFHQLQLAKWRLQPLTKDDFAKYELIAEYKKGD